MKRSRRAEKLLSVALAGDASTDERPRQQRRVNEVENDSQQTHLGPERPSQAERAAANAIIVALQKVETNPPLLRKGASVEVETVACALAIHFGQNFRSDVKAKKAFEVGPTTNVRGLWVDGKLTKLAELNPAALETVRTVFQPSAEPAQPSPPPASSHGESSAPEVTPPVSALVVAPEAASDDPLEASLRDAIDHLHKRCRSGTRRGGTSRIGRSRSSTGAASVRRSTP